MTNPKFNIGQEVYYVEWWDWEEDIVDLEIIIHKTQVEEIKLRYYMDSANKEVSYIIKNNGMNTTVKEWELSSTYTEALKRVEEIIEANKRD